MLRSLPTLLAILMLAPAGFAQKGRVYMNAVLEPCSRKQAAYYLEPEKGHGELFRARIFDMKGQLKAEGTYADEEHTIPNGAFTFYHPNGRVESNGQYVSGLKSGVWQRFDEWGRELAEKVYDTEPLKDIVFTRAHTMPEFPGGEKEFVKYVRDRIEKRSGKRSKATASFIVEKDGRISEIKVIDADDADLRSRVAEVLMSSPRWTPGEENGRHVRVQMRMPIP